MVNWKTPGSARNLADFVALIERPELGPAWVEWLRWNALWRPWEGPSRALWQKTMWCQRVIPEAVDSGLGRPRPQGGAPTGKPSEPGLYPIWPREEFLPSLRDNPLHGIQKKSLQPRATLVVELQGLDGTRGQSPGDRPPR